MLDVRPPIGNFEGIESVRIIGSHADLIAPSVVWPVIDAAANLLGHLLFQFHPDMNIRSYESWVSKSTKADESIGPMYGNYILDYRNGRPRKRRRADA